MDTDTSSIKIEIPEPRLDDPESFCRFCYSTSDVLSIFPTNGNPGQRVIDLVEQLLGIGLSVSEDFPSAICRQCHNKLEDFDYFRRKSKIYNDEIRKLRLGFIEDASLTVKYEEVTENGEDPTNLWRKKENKEPEMELTAGEIETKIEYGEWKIADEKPLSNDLSKRKIKPLAGQTGPLMRKLKQQVGLLRKPKKQSLRVPITMKDEVFTKNGENKKSEMEVTVEELDENPTAYPEPKIDDEKSKPRLSIKRKTPAGQTGPLTGQKPKKQNLEPQDHRCKICEEFFPNKNSINQHMKVHIDVDNVCCRNCQKTFPTIHGVVTHALQTYITTSFPCQNCGVLFKSRESLLAHELYCDKNSAQTLVELNMSKPFQCQQCPKSFKTSLRLYDHKQIHELRITCGKCGSNFPTPTDLRNHEARYHSNGSEQIASTVKCEACQRTFVDASAYRMHHTQVHKSTGDQASRKLDERKLYECDQCDKKFWSINTIRYHVLVHRKYRDCDQCSESFRSNKKLQEHKMSAHPVKCDFCPKKFFQKRSLRTHCNKIHGMLQIKHLTEDERVTYSWHKVLYKCASCEQDYEKYGQLKDHYGRTHPASEKMLIRCTKCDALSASIIGYMGHLTGNCGQTPRRFKAWH